MMVHLSRGLAGAVILGALAAAPSSAQDDVAKALVGKWQGEVQFRDAGADRSNRTLVIESVSVKEGTATGRYPPAQP